MFEERGGGYGVTLPPCPGTTAAVFKKIASYLKHHSISMATALHELDKVRACEIAKSEHSELRSRSGRLTKDSLPPFLTLKIPPPMRPRFACRKHGDNILTTSELRTSIIDHIGCHISVAEGRFMGSYLEGLGTVGGGEIR